ncbi:hypothetical protein CHH28_02915 [Bacterioplanes sanyensis]|uniref:Uncharacterized protein n=1 Tax=Bacterioplanes sanyensis TaxID=1249553 RepID=A0A222FGR8_9GAMM|nr:hypothetical protein [Bacterioplanes sanyensis]ASP37684.1 hypothetical protein CHH28_02915 [Bacterioplanes sanyensis]
MKFLNLLFLALMLITEPALASEVSGYPTAIAMTVDERRQQIAAATDNTDTQQQRIAWLAELANITAESSRDEQRIQQLQHTLTQALKASPEDAELMAALGSLLSYQSSLHTDNLAKLNVLMRKGTRYMDRAIKQAPHHLGARLQRGIACANMPAFVKRAHFAVQDLTMVREQVGQRYGADFLAFVEYYLGQALLRNGEPDAARQVWQGIDQHAEQWSTKAQQALAAL